jgi:methyl-accepting chemotaxis protein
MSRRAIDLSLIAGLVVTLLVGLVLFNAYERRTEAAAAGHLTTMLMLRESVLTSHFESLRSEVTLWSGQPIIRDILESLASAKQQNELNEFGDRQTSEFSNAAPTTQPMTLYERVSAFTEHHGYYDVFFISASGDVLFTAARESDLGTNLIDGPYADTGLGRLFQALAGTPDDSVAMEDFSRYPPSNNEPAAFLGARVTDSQGNFIGVYAVQIPEQSINDIMQYSAGMGETGETYLVGEDGLMRSTSRFFDDSTVLVSEVSGDTVDRALAGEAGIEIVDDYRGVPVFSAHRPFEFEGIRWAMLAEQDVAEVEAPVDRARLWLIGAFAALCVTTLALRFLLQRMVVPASLAALLGLSFVPLDDGD